MSSAISLEYLQSITGAKNGLATLVDGKIPSSQLPASAAGAFKGEYATITDLTTAHPTGNLGDYAYLTQAAGFFYWNAKLTAAAWVPQNITAANYSILVSAEKAAVPYIIVP